MSFSINPLKLSLPIKVILLITAVALFGEYIPLEAKEFFLALSGTLKGLLEFVLPVIIFSYLASCLLSFKRGAIAFAAILLTAVFISNFFTTQIAYFASIFTVSKVITTTESAGNLCAILNPAFDIAFPHWIEASYALWAGLITGILFSIVRSKEVEQFTELLKKASNFFLMEIFIPVVPLFILGFIIKLEHEGVLTKILTSYAPVFILVTLLEVGYGIILFGFATKFNPAEWMRQLKNTIPAFITGLSTMSSAGSMPLTLLAAEKNTKNPEVAKVLIPATVNIHMIGNAITVPVMAFALLNAYGLPFPPYHTYVLFGALFAFRQFTVAAVPSGGILMMIPILEQYMGLTPDMTTLMVSLYTLFDSPLTASNIVGNVAFASIMNKLLTKLRIIKNSDDSPAEEAI